MHIIHMPLASNKIVPGTTYAAVVGQILARRRDAIGMQQATLAKSVGMKQSSWSRIESGQSALNVEQLRIAADALRITADEIVRQADEATNKLAKHGVQVSYRGMTDDSGVMLALLGGAALGGLLYSLLSKK